MLSIVLLLSAIAAAQAGYASVYPYASYAAAPAAPYSYGLDHYVAAPVVKTVAPLATSYSNVYKAATPSYPVVKSYAPVAYHAPLAYSAPIYKSYAPLAYSAPIKSYYGSYGHGLDYGYSGLEHGYNYGQGLGYGYGYGQGLGYGYGGYLH